MQTSSQFEERLKRLKGKISSFAKTEISSATTANVLLKMFLDLKIFLVLSTFLFLKLSEAVTEFDDDLTEIGGFYLDVSSHHEQGKIIKLILI